MVEAGQQELRMIDSGTHSRDMDKIVRGQKATQTEWDAALQRS